MLAILFAWLYISFLCWSWGILSLRLLKHITGCTTIFPHFSLVCLTGLSMITILAGILSLFIPLGEWWVQFIFIIPAGLLFFIKDVPYFFSTLKKTFSSLHISSILLLSSLLVMILVMSSWIIVHPDTLGYHAQTMQWIEKFRAVPGLVHLHVRFGYQGLWFVDCALFDFSFTGKQGVTFLNSAVLFWFFLIVINRIDHNFFKEGKNIYGLLWIGLLFVCCWSYTQVRLTATSASPDFIATMYVLAVIYILLEKDLKQLPANNWFLASILGVVAVSIKLSVAPILITSLAATYLLLVTKKTRSLLVLIIITALTFSAFVARNIITSGYVIFPDTTIDVAHVDWKYSARLTAQEKNYITAYAKKPGVSMKEDIDRVNEMRISGWLPGWWQIRSVADKTIIILLVIAVLTATLFFKTIINRGRQPLFLLLTMLGGIIFWFMTAPDPRFGFGFILGFIAIVSYLLGYNKEIHIGRSVRILMPVVFSAIIFTYTGYRFIHFFLPGQLLSPLAIENSEYHTFHCREIRIHSPLNGEFGDTPVPCTDLNCGHFTPRGTKVNDGFRAK